MKKFIKWVLVPVVIIFVIGMGVIYFSFDFASEKIITKVSEELESSGKIEVIKEAVKSDPEIAGFIKEVETDPEARQFLEDQKTNSVDNRQNSDTNMNEKSAETASLNKTNTELPIQTKEEAVKVVVDRVGITELNSMVKRFKEGTASKQELIQEASTQFTEEELMALKIIAYKELYSN